MTRQRRLAETAPRTVLLSACAALALVLAAVPAAPASEAAAPLVVDSGDDVSAWTPAHSPSASVSIAAGEGRDTGSVALRFDLGRGRGHVIARREVSLDLPDDYTFVFTVRGEAEPNTLEIKFVSGANVWWRRLPDFVFSHEAREVRVSKQRISFAWGPSGGGMPKHLDAIEIAVVSGRGGKGRLWIDGIRVEPLDPVADARPPSVVASSNPGDAAFLLDGNAATVWRSSPGDRHASVTLDFHRAVEQGGLEVEHAAGGYARAWRVEASVDGLRWAEVRRFRRSDGGRDEVFLPDVFARYLRLRFDLPPGRVAAIAELRPQPYEYSSSENAFFTAIAREAAPGLYPRYFTGEQSYWTVLGAAGQAREGLINEEGSVEVGAGGFTLEPFVWRDGRLSTWKDSTNSVSLDGGDLPIPTVTRRDGDLTLAVTAFAAESKATSGLLVRYRLALAKGRERVRLFTALRPFQVLPPWQALNRTGGVARVAGIKGSLAKVEVDGLRVVPRPRAEAFGAAAFEQGDVSKFLLRGDVPPFSAVKDDFGHASAALAWDLDLEAGVSRDVWVEVPWTGPAIADPAGALEEARSVWRERLDRVGFALPPVANDWADSLRSNLAWILINADGPALQPGSRAYERSWIRDGAMTSGALLELGFDAEVKAFLRWYAGFLGSDGWVPCCVDARGADPVPEHDSFGEFLWAVAETWRFTRDEAFVREMWPRVKAVAACMSRLRAKRMTPVFEEEGRRPFYGLLPESISHEGYSARPVHSYWDQAFALRGYADAAMLARVVGDDAAAVSLDAERRNFAASLRDSIARTMAAHRMELVPASVELADFDPTSTAVSFLLGTESVYPRDALLRSYRKFVGDLRARRGLATPGVGYTAYELRNATALVLLGMKEEAIELLGTLTDDQRPPAWNQWPEISWLRKTEPSFLGDLPHTWIGSTYVHAVRSLLVTERDDAAAGGGEASLLVGAGIPLDWLQGGGEAGGEALPTWFGALSLRIRRDDGGAGSQASSTAKTSNPRVVLDVGPAAAATKPFVMPSGGVRVAAPFGADLESATVDRESRKIEDGSILLRELPATVVFQYKPRRENPL